MKKKTIFLVVGCMAFMATIHCAFFIPAPIRFLEANWEAGDVLTFVGTALLGWLAIWQNEELKEENEKSQKRLEQITKEANQLTLEANKLSSLSKIVDYELGKKADMEKKIKQFEESLSVQEIVQAIDKETEEVDMNVVVGLEERLDNAYLQICIEFDMPIKFDNEINEDDYCKVIRDINKEMKKLISLLKCDRKLSDIVLIKDIIKNINRLRMDMETQKNLYFKTKREKLDFLIYGNEEILDGLEKIY